ncbi:MAG: WD40 repeat domain-containing protein [Aggregatilineales bacterium]
MRTFIVIRKLTYTLLLSLYLMLLLILSATPLSAQEESPSDGIPDNLVPITAQNAADLAPIFSIQTPLSSVSTMVFSPDSRFLFFGGPGGILVMPLDAPDSIALIENNPFTLQGGIAFSQDGALLATANVDSIRIWDMLTGQAIQILNTDYPAGNMQFSPDGRVLAVGADGFAPDNTITANQVYLWDVNSGEQYGAVGYPYSWLDRSGSVAFRFSADGEVLWTVIGPFVHAWDYRQPEIARDPLLFTQADYFDRLMSFRYTPETATVYSWTAFTNADGGYALWLTDSNGESQFVTQDGDVQFVTNGISGENHDEDGIPQTIDNFTRLERAEVVRALSTLEQISFMLGDTTLQLINRREAAATTPRYAYDEANGTLVDEISGTVYFLEDDGIAGRFADISGDPLPTLSTYYTVNDSPPAEAVFVLDTSRFNFSDDGTILAEVDTDENGHAQVSFTNLETNTVSQFAVPSIFVDRLIFNPTGELALVYFDRMYFIVDVATGELIAPLDVIGNAVFNAEGTLLVTQYFGELTFWGVVGE